MSLDRFVNKDQVSGYTPTFGKTIEESISTQDLFLSENEIKGDFDLVNGLDFPPNQELHIYADTNLIQSTYNNFIQYTQKNSRPSVYTTPELDLRNNGIQQGAYSMVYNFHHKIVSNLKVDEISADRTEIKLVYAGSGITNGFIPAIQSVLNDIGVNAFDTNGVKKDIVLNFKNNNIYDIINAEFGGLRAGVITETLTYPTSILDGTPTTYVPFDSTFEGSLNSWRTMVEVITPAIGESSDDFGKLTGRFRRYQLVQNPDGTLSWQAGQNTFVNQVPEDLDAAEPSLQSAINSGNDIFAESLSPSALNLTYKRFDNTVTQIQSVILKLNRPLGDDVDVNNLCDVDARIMKSWVEKIIAFPSIQNQSRPDFSEPDFSLDMSDMKGADSVDWQNWESLLDVDATTSQQLINYYFSGSLGQVKLNIDYSDFQNYVHFSSATERVDNFRYKLQQIEKFNDRITLLESVSGSDALTNISQSMVRRDRIIGGFDDFEQYLYYDVDSNIYTHWSSSDFTIEPYPKSSTFPHVLRESDSTEGVNWYNGVYASASLYDEFNDARLRNMIPIHLQEDERNEEYITFVDMIGQHFDIQWAYIKSLTDINEREEHPKDGMADDLLKSVAESLGWKLSNGYSDVSLWKYALGVESDGTLYQTGSLQSKSRREITNETWRRIVNTIPMLYKTKGSARSIKAILSTYGIPQAFLKIREWGGPTISTRKNVYEHERFVYKLQASPSKYISNPWDDIQSDRPNSIEVIGKMPKQNYHILRLTDNSDNVDLFWDYENETARIRLKVNSTDIISSSYVPYKQRREVAVVLTSGSINISAAWVDDWGEILANPTATLTGNNSTFNTVWTSTGTLRVPGPTTDSNVNSYETASIQEVRYFRDGISNEIVTEHAKNREAYFSDDNTTDLDIDTSFDKLMYRIFPDSGFTTNTGSIDSVHPNQKFTSSDSGLVLSASLINMKPGDLVGEVDTQFVTVPSVGALNLMNNKIRIESASLKGALSPDKSNELSEFDYAPLDSNLLGTYFTTTDTVNFDIYNSEGYFEADDWVGDPDKRYNEDYPLLKYRAKNYFQKYTSGTALDLIMDMLSRYDMSVFDQIKQLLPARVDWHKGILIEPHVFERNKYQRERDITISRHHYDGTIPVGTNIITASRNDYGLRSGSGFENDGMIDLYNYEPSVYQYDLAVLSGGTYVNRTNGYWEYSPTGSTIINARLSNIYQEPKYFFTSSEDAETLTPSSTSFHYAEVQDTRLPLSIENLYYNGCRITSDSLTTDSPDTPDGGPVVEITEVDSNILVFSGRPGEGLDTDGNIKGGSTRTMPIDNLVSTTKDRFKKVRPKPSRVSETETFRPLPFKPTNTRPKLRLPSRGRQDGVMELIAKRTVQNLGHKLFAGNVYYFNQNFLNDLQSGNYDWGTLQQINGTSYQMTLNGNVTTSGYMTTNGTNTIIINSITNPLSATYNVPTIVQLAYVFVVKRSTGQVVYSSADLQGITSHQFGFGGKGVSQSVTGNEDLEIRIFAYT
jgi:hypothetical protein